MVKEGQVMMFDSGTTTTTAIARALRSFQNLTIITNAVNIAAELAGTAVEVIPLGGLWARIRFRWSAHRRRNPARPECRSFVFRQREKPFVHERVRRRASEIIPAKISRTGFTKGFGDLDSEGRPKRAGREPTEADP